MIIYSIGVILTFILSIYLSKNCKDLDLSEYLLIFILSVFSWIGFCTLLVYILFDNIVKDVESW